MSCLFSFSKVTAARSELAGFAGMFRFTVRGPAPSRDPAPVRGLVSPDGHAICRSQLTLVTATVSI